MGDRGLGKPYELRLERSSGAENPVQGFPQHKAEEVVGYLPEYLKEQGKAAMRAAFRLPAQEGTSFVPSGRV